MEAKIEPAAQAANQATAIASAFVSARRAKQALAAYPGEKPVTLAQAYAVQDHAIALDGRPVVGWKVARVRDGFVAELDANRLAGPVLAGTIFASGAQVPVIAGGFVAGEAEFMLRLADDYDGSIPATLAAAQALVAEVRIGLEIAGSPYARINADGPCVTASDFGNNAALVLGPIVENWRNLSLVEVPVSCWIDDQLQGEASAATMLDGPYGALCFLLAHLAQRGLVPKGGTWISSGAITGVHEARAGQSVRARFGNLGEVSCQLVEAGAWA